MALGDPEHGDLPLYRDRRTERFASGERVKEFQAFEKQAKKRLAILLSARYLSDLVLLPSNHLETLGGDRRGSSASESIANGESVSNGQMGHLVP